MKKKVVKLTHHAYACNSLTYFHLEAYVITGNGSYVDQLTLAWKHSVKPHQVNVFFGGKSCSQTTVRYTGGQRCSCSAVAQLCTGHKKLVKTSRGTTNGSSCVSWPSLQPLARGAQSAKLLCNNLERPLVDGLAAADSWLKPKAPNGHGEIEMNDTSAHHR